MPTLGDGAEPTLTGVSCMSGVACMAVGNAFWGQEGCCAGNSQIAERWNGRRWSLILAPTELRESTFSAVSCISTRWCIAVGYAGLGPDCPGSNQTNCAQIYASAEHWNGRRWAEQPSPTVLAWATSVLEGVSCVSARFCIAVGEIGGAALAERFDGRRWFRQRFPKARLGGLSSVSCASPSFCVAVGGTNPGTPLIARWDGTRWAVQRAPRLGTGAVLASVSCPSSHFCAAVGQDDTRRFPRPSSELWDGKRWSPHPATSTAGAFLGVTCTLARSCTAVGEYYTDANGDRRPLIEHYS